MTFFDSGLVNFVKLLIIVGLISMLYMLVMQKIKEQNHKISSLLSLVTTMANEITYLKEPSAGLEEILVNHEKNDEKNDISDDSDSDYDSDSDESINLEEIDLVKGDKITMTESSIEEISEIEDLNEPELVATDVLEKNTKPANIKKMNIQQLVEMAVSKKLKTKSEADKMKKKDLLELFD